MYVVCVVKNMIGNYLVGLWKWLVVHRKTKMLKTYKRTGVVYLVLIVAAHLGMRVFPPPLLKIIFGQQKLGKSMEIIFQNSKILGVVRVFMRGVCM